MNSHFSDGSGRSDSRWRPARGAALGIEGRRWRLPVTITPPNKLDYDRRFGEAIVREFLLVRGFMQLPARQERRRTALG